MTPSVEARGLEKIYLTPAGPVPVLRGVDFTLAAGGFCAVTGPSGSGKTTFLNLVALLDKPTGGTLSVAGTTVSAADAAARAALRREKIGMIFQAFHLLPHRSVLENVLFRARYIPGARRDMLPRAHALLEQFGLAGAAGREARLLSGGEMQRVAIARALLTSPEVLVADEPTGNLDRASAEAVMESLAEVNGQGIAIMLVTHNPAWLPLAREHYECREGRLWRVR